MRQAAAVRRTRRGLSHNTATRPSAAELATTAYSGSASPTTPARPKPRPWSVIRPVVLRLRHAAAQLAGRGVKHETVEPEDVGTPEARDEQQHEREGEAGDSDEREQGEQGEPGERADQAALRRLGGAGDADHLAHHGARRQHHQPPADRGCWQAEVVHVRSGERLGGDRAHGNEPAEQQQAAQRYVREDVPDACRVSH